MASRNLSALESQRPWPLVQVSRPIQPQQSVSYLRLVPVSLSQHEFVDEHVKHALARHE